MSFISACFLFVLIAMIFFVVLNKCQFDLSSPSAVVCIMSMLSIMIMMLFVQKYQIELSIKMILIVPIAILSFCMGSFIYQRKINNILMLSDADIKVYGRSKLLFSLFFVLVTTFLYYKEVMRISELYGFNNSSMYGFLYYYRSASITDGSALESQSKIVGQMVIASYAISYLVLIDFAKRIIYHRIVKDKISFVFEIGIVVLFSAQNIISGGRTQFLYYIESFVFLLVFLYGKKTAKAVSIKIVKKLLIILLVTFVAFYYIGGLTGKTSKYDILTTLFIYVGSPFAAFNELIVGNVHFTQEFFGSNTFFGFTDFLNKFGMNIPQKEMSAPFVQIGNVDTNIYGSFARYYIDFGFLGMILILIALGLIYQRCYSRLLTNNKELDLRLCFYLVIMKTIYDFAIEERFFMSVISLGTLLRMIYIVLFYYIFRIRWKVKSR